MSIRVFPTGGRNIDRDLIGDRGQSIAFLALTQPVGMKDSLFRPRFLGDKFPAVDFIVKLDKAPCAVPPFCFVQVKAAREGYNRSGNLKVQVSKKTMTELIAYPVPTYLIGVDDADEGTSYIVAAVPGGPTH